MKIKKIKKLTGRDDLSDKEITHHAYQLYVKEYLRCVKGIDDNLQRIFDYLKDNDLLENTIVIYTSDQGYFLGEHGFFDYSNSVHSGTIYKQIHISMPSRIRYRLFFFKELATQQGWWPV